MSRVEEIERAVQELSSDEFARIARHVHVLEQERWAVELDHDVIGSGMQTPTIPRCDTVGSNAARI
jgi:hypothetical protein